jgi:type IV pilus assembly protein PilY1
MGSSFDPDNPGQAYGCMENYPGVVPHPLITVQYNQRRHSASGDSWESTIQPITVEPDVIVPCALGQKGYLVVFGTGRYISDNEINDKSGQTIYGIWDWADEWIHSGVDTEPYDKYLGTLELPVSPESGLVPPYPALIRKVSNAASFQVTREIPETEPPVNITGTGVSLLEQVQISGATDINSAVYRVLSNYETNWYSPEDQEGEHVGWFFNLPGRGERVVTGLSVRDGILDVISTQPSPSPCSGGIVSIIHGIDACTGGRPDYPYFDINGDGVIDSNDMINMGSDASPQYVAPTGLYRQGML